MKQFFLSCSILFLFCALTPVQLFAETTVGKVKGTRGLVSIIRNGKTAPAFPGDAIYQSDTIITGSNGAIGILMEDNTLISMGPISRVKMEKFLFKPDKNEYAMKLRMIEGTFVYQSGLLGKLAPHAVELDTPVGRISMLKGTDFKAKFAARSGGGGRSLIRQ
ncbi:FecR family protein [Desulfomarina sp.]